MRKASVSVTLNRFEHWMDFYIDLLNKSIHRDSPFETKLEKCEVIEGFVFKICAQWEVLTEDLMIDCLNKDSSQYAYYMDLRLPKHLPRPQCIAMILGLGYLDFKSVSDIKNKAKNILAKEYNPFNSISKSDSNKIDEFYRIRNYLAHYSNTSHRSLEKLYKNTYKLNTFRQPGDFLLSVDRNTNKPRMQTYINAFMEASACMSRALGIES